MALKSMDPEVTNRETYFSEFGLVVIYEPFCFLAVTFLLRLWQIDRQPNVLLGEHCVPLVLLPANQVLGFVICYYLF